MHIMQSSGIEVCFINDIPIQESNSEKQLAAPNILSRGFLHNEIKQLEPLVNAV